MRGKEAIEGVLMNKLPLWTTGHNPTADPLNDFT